MSNTCEVLENVIISPVRRKTKHTCTPMRTRRKTSRRDQGLDVHTVKTSTPTAHRSPRLQRQPQDSPLSANAEFNSPSSSFPCSQDGRPDVVWDFTSPILPKGSRKKELKLTVQELLDNLNQCQAVECSSKSNPHIKLLESWMSKLPAEGAVKEIKNHKRKEVKKRSGHHIEELKKFIDSIQQSKCDQNLVPNLRSPVGLNVEKEKNIDLSEQKKSFKNSFLDNNSTDDSSEELWSDIDNSFIIKATQELETISVVASDQVGDMLSTIPETAPHPSVLKIKSHVIEPKKKSCEQHSELLLQLSNIDWEEDEWDKGFLLEDNELSLVPDDILSGESVQQLKSGTEEPAKTDHSFVNNSNNNDTKVKKIVPDNMGSLEEVQFLAKPKNVSNAELINSFEDGSFEEESLLCQPEVLSKLDEVESLLSQPKCTPEEIRKKKDEALKRRKKTQSKRKT